ncbi:hypothetical protein [Alcanivorax jadensis]|uniref:hypothetical protein n=1 Tax=Alcanivorax jadensis TaxID=64988 RepID=UPI002352D753|nr:hypothetical protein [Alcanivorax jadensis]|tara:strand:+ start:141 stop:542 length:402 start_codon:yes stop_codon:yes gene_type:complete
MTVKWRLLASAVVCLVAIVSAFHFLVMERHGVPDSGIRVVEQGNEEGGRDWVIRLYQSDSRHHWQASGSGYDVAIDRLAKDSFSLDIAYGVSGDGRHRIRQQVRLHECPTLVAAFGAGPTEAGDTRVIVDRVK